jgi:hypothetical protein
MTKPIVTEEKKTAAPVVVDAAAKALAQIEDVSAWGAAPVTAQDIIIPRILLMQPMSDAVTNGKAAFGEFRESLNNELMGKFEDGFEVVPFAMHKVFVEYEQASGGKKEYLRTVPITPANEGLPYEDKEKNDEGRTIAITRDRVLNVYCLLPKELETGGAIPYIISFRRSSMQAGKKISTQMFVKNHAAGKNPAAVMCKIWATKETNDEGTFGVMDVTPTKPTPTEWQAEAFKWLGIVNSGRAKVDESSYNEETKTEVSKTVGNVTANGPEKF